MSAKVNIGIIFLSDISFSTTVSPCLNKTKLFCVLEILWFPVLDPHNDATHRGQCWVPQCSTVSPFFFTPHWAQSHGPVLMSLTPRSSLSLLGHLEPGCPTGRDVVVYLHFIAARLTTKRTLRITAIQCDTYFCCLSPIRPHPSAPRACQSHPNYSPNFTKKLHFSFCTPRWPSRISLNFHPALEKKIRSIGVHCGINY